MAGRAPKDVPGATEDTTRARWLVSADDRFVQFGQAVNVCLYRELEARGCDATAELDHVDRR